MGVVRDVLAGVAQGTDDPAVRRPPSMGAGEVGQVLAGAHLQQDEPGVGEQHVEGVAEPHRPAQMRAPVLGAGRLLGGDPGAGDVRQERDRRGPQRDGADLVDERADGAVHVGRVESVRGVQTAAAHALVREPLLEGVDGLRGAGDHAQRRGVDGGQRQAVAEPGGDLLLGQEDAEHGAVRHLLDQPAACGDQTYRVLQREHARQAGGHVLADAVADHGARLDTPRLPQPGQGELHAEQRRLGEPGLPQPVGGRRVVRTEHQGAQVICHIRVEQLRAAVELGGEDTPLGVQVAGHAGILGALPGEEERDRGVAGRGGRGRGRALRQAAQRGDGLAGGAGDDRAAVVEGGTALSQRVGDGVKADAVVGFQMVGQQRGRLGQRGRGLRGQRQQPGRGPGPGAGGFLRLLGGRLLQDDVDVRAADPEGADAGPARLALARPGAQFGVHVERAALQLQAGVGPLPVQGGRDRLVLEGEHRLDQAGDTGGGVEVTDVALDRADRARAPGVGARTVGAGERGDLDGIPQRGAGAMGLHEADTGRVDVGQGQRLGDDVGLPVDTRRGVTGLQGTVVVDRTGQDDRIHAVAVGTRVGEAAQDDEADPVAGHGALGVGVEGTAGALRGQDAARLVLVAAAQRRAHRHTPGQRDVALAVDQALAGQVHRAQRRGAGRLDGDRRTRQVQLVRGARGQEVLVGGQHHLVHARGVQDLLVVHEVEQQIRVQARAREDTDAAAEARRVDSGGLQGVPGAFEEDPVLGVQQLGLARAVAEEALVEQVRALQHALGPDVVVPGDQGGVDAAGGEFLVGRDGDALASLREVGPEAVHIARAGEAARHPDDGDAIEVLVLFRRLGPDLVVVWL